MLIILIAPVILFTRKSFRYNWNILNFTQVGFLRCSEDISGGQSIDTRIDMRPDEDLAVDIDATFDPETGRRC